MKLLHIDSSILGPNSVSRTLTAEIVERQRRLHPEIEVTYRDLAAEPHLHFSPAHIAAAQGATPDAAVSTDLASGGAVLDELFAADIIVIGAPMYNFAVPSQLKAWIDRSLIAGRTFHYTATGPEGLLPKGKKVIIASSRGGFYGPNSPTATFDHQESYLKQALGFIGLTDITVVRAEGIAVSPESRKAALASARTEISALAA
ncbi:MAG: azoR [Rhodospirillales bacterium]|nr:azoR [Rhodospirillales bacterium]